MNRRCLPALLLSISSILFFCTAPANGQFRSTAAAAPVLPLAPNSTDKSDLSTGHVIWATSLQVVVGAAAGTLFGGLIGGFWPAKDSGGDRFTNAFRGAAIGAALSPTLLHELWIKKMKRTHPNHRWAMAVGINQTTTNHPSTQSGNGWSTGIHRSYHLADRCALVSGVSYTQRRFSLPRQTLIYDAGTVYKSNIADIEVNIAYIDLFLQAKVRFQTPHFDLGLAAGPALAVQIREATHYVEREILEIDHRPAKWDFIYQAYEPAATLPVVGYLLSLELQREQFFTQIRLHHAFVPSYQIYPLDDRTRIRNLDLVVGVYLN